ncbi:hypothetical protein PC129_g23452 [Phytophthora cactorum]|uniref:Uncharacterized protein n=1 Tax=Phytophthora cactorum TaxID=29920 RepID=A0A8T1GUR0_9STRA|nr:hypothetical protein Pcac1_g956 [Phytophthora cactorum]KAG2871947.1 hypothetical protein PC114_g26642 [Phytophthora cactorum]KAG2880691.1 hypothetical protein PC117_g26516 [Phytophthora cactorum]KAG2960626.1 hypothetical protein PC119_g26334 [Phytophthora cactorum]KAG2972681.1 hypothetical protein PC120_g26266 [Phytophthora cactorum]
MACAQMMCTPGWRLQQKCEENGQRNDRSIAAAPSAEVGQHSSALRYSKSGFHAHRCVWMDEALEDDYELSA